MMPHASEEFKKRESLRCLFASVASMEVIDWLLESGQLTSVAVNAHEIDRRLSNVRSFFLTGWGLTKEEVEEKFIPMGSLLLHHVYEALFSDAVRWWAAAHRSRQDERKYLRDSMYKGDFADLRHHFYHGFRNNQLAHFPGGIQNNDNPLLTPSPYGFFLSQKEVDDFRSLLAYSIKLTMVGAEKSEELVNEISDFISAADMPDESKAAAAEAVKHMLGKFDKEFLKIPTRDYLTDQSP